MKRHFAMYGALALALVSYLSAGAQANPLMFTYDWTPTVTVVSGNGGFNGINFSNQGPVTVSTPTVVGTATSLMIQNSNSDNFNNAAFNLGVKITDGSNSGTMMFGGTFQGVVASGVAESLTAAFTNPSQTIVLGADKFTVNMTGFVPPNPVGSGNKPGGFGFSITATPGPGGGSEPPPNDVPEPTTFLLSCLGLGGFALRSLRNRAK